MSRNTRFIWCILAALLFCAVTYGGCGGSSNLASVADTSGGGTSQPVSGDTSGGRGDWEVISVIFDDLNSTFWSIQDIKVQGLSNAYCTYGGFVTQFRVSDMSDDGNSATITVRNIDDILESASINVGLKYNGKAYPMPFMSTSAQYTRIDKTLYAQIDAYNYCMINVNGRPFL